MSKAYGDMGGLVRQAQKMQADLKRLQAELKERIVEGKAGGDAVVAYANGNQEVVQIRVQPSVVDPDEVEDLEDLVLTAVRAALEAAKKMADEETARVTGGLGGKMPFPL